MVISLIQNLANQIIRERFFRYSYISVSENRTFDAMLMASGDRLRQILGLVQETSQLDSDVTWSKAVAYGINPVRLRTAGIGYKNPYKTDDDHGLSDPLHIAAYYAVFGNEEAAKLVLEERAALIKSRDRWAAAKMPEFFRDPDLGKMDWGKWFTDRNMTRTWVIPDFEELRLPRVAMDDQVDSFYLEGAFTPESYTHRLKQRLGPQNIEAFAMISGLKNRDVLPAMREAAFDQARKLCTGDKKGGFRYADMAVFVRLCTPQRAASLFDDLQGSRKMVALFRSDTSEEHYVMGLRQLAQSAPDVRKEILERIGRAPTIDEVRAVRSIGIINILDEMDWMLIEPVTKQPGLRAAALPYAEKLGPVVLRRFLTDHPGRVKRLPNIENEADRAAKNLRITDASSIADWETVMDRLHRMNRESIMVREALRDVTENDTISFLALLKPHGASSPDIENAVRSHPQWKHIERVLADYTPPNLYKLWS
jgi:hypothetical protein